MIIVAKSVQRPENGPIDYVEAQLPAFRAILAREQHFVYAWTFRPDYEAIAELRQNLPVWLYLIGKRWCSPLRMRVANFHTHAGAVACPQEWLQYAARYDDPDEEYIDGYFHDWGRSIGLWFLIVQIEPVQPPIDVSRLKPFFEHKYKTHGQNFFGFFRQDGDC